MRIEAGTYRPSRSTINRAIIFFACMVGGLAYAATLNTTDDRFVATLMALGLGGETALVCLFLRDWLE